MENTQNRFQNVMENHVEFSNPPMHPLLLVMVQTGWRSWWSTWPI